MTYLKYFRRTGTHRCTSRRRWGGGSCQDSYFRLEPIAPSPTRSDSSSNYQYFHANSRNFSEFIDRFTSLNRYLPPFVGEARPRPVLQPQIGFCTDPIFSTSSYFSFAAAITRWNWRQGWGEEEKKARRNVTVQ